MKFHSLRLNIGIFLFKTNLNFYSLERKFTSYYLGSSKSIFYLTIFFPENSMLRIQRIIKLFLENFVISWREVFIYLIIRIVMSRDKDFVAHILHDKPNYFSQMEDGQLDGAII